MRPCRLLTCLLALMLATAVVPAQATGAPPGRTCATMDHLAHLRQVDKGLDARMATIEAQTQAFASQGPGRQATNIVTIPVVFHVIYNTASENISDQQVFSQVDVLNEDFRRTNPDAINTPPAFLPVAADTEIQFCLATVDPNNQPTTGITRTQTSVSSFSTNDNMKFSSSGGHDAWPADRYLNFWVCDLGGGLLGYAQFPGGPAATDGVVCDYQATGRVGNVTTPYHLGRTATHEVGHWLNLRHIWGDGGCGVDDYVADTPLSDAPNYGCPTGSVACGSTDMPENYMDYSDDPCFNLFTSGQKTRMQALFSPGGAREVMLASGGCGAPGAPLYQVNQPKATLTIDGVVGTSGIPAITSHCFGGAGQIDLVSVNDGLPFDMGIVLGALVPSTAGGLATAAGQVINLNMTLPTLSFYGSGTPMPGFPTWAGNLSIPYVTPSASLDLALQMIKLDPTAADGFHLSQGAQLSVGAASNLPAGPSGDDSSITVDLSASCIGSMTFYGTSYTQLFISSNGRVLFGGSDSDYTPSVAEILNDNPFVGFWSDLDPSAGGSVNVTSPVSGVIRVAWQNVPYWGTSTTVSFAVEFDAASGAITLDGLAGILPNPSGLSSSGTRQFLGITRGNAGGTRPARTTFAPSLSGGTSNATDAIYDYCNDGSSSWGCGGHLSSLQTGLNTLVFTPNASGGYDWVGF